MLYALENKQHICIYFSCIFLEKFASTKVLRPTTNFHMCDLKTPIFNVKFMKEKNMYTGVFLGNHENMANLNYTCLSFLASDKTHFSLVYKDEIFVKHYAMRFGVSEHGVALYRGSCLGS